MIIELLFTAVKGLFTLIVEMLPSIPAIPDNFLTIISDFFDLLSSGLGIFYFFVRPSTVAIALPIALAIVNFEHIYRFIIWVVRKIPFIGID